MDEVYRVSTTDEPGSIAISRPGATGPRLATCDPAPPPKALVPRPTRGRLFQEAEAYQRALLQEIRSSRILSGRLRQTWGDRLSAIRLSVPTAGLRLQGLLDEVDRCKEREEGRHDFGQSDGSWVDLLNSDLGSIARRLSILIEMRDRALD